jgi:hypothetical protein
VLVVLLASTIVGVGSIPASAHCSLGPFDAAIRFSDNVWAGEVVSGRKIDDPQTPYELTLRVDEVLSGADPGPTVKILAWPCKKLSGIAPSTIGDYVGITGVFAISDLHPGYFYVETFQPEGDPVAAAKTLLATDPFPSPSASSIPATVSPVPPVATPTETTNGASSAIPIVVGALAVLGIGFGFLVRAQSRKTTARKTPAKKRPAPKGKQRSAKTGSKPTKARR